MRDPVIPNQGHRKFNVSGSDSVRNDDFVGSSLFIHRVPPGEHHLFVRVLRRPVISFPSGVCQEK